MKVQYRTILAGLEQERDKILAALNVDTTKLKADLATIEHAIAIYQPRVTESAKERLPKILAAAKKIRSDNNGNGRPTHYESGLQQRWARMRMVLADPNNSDRKGMASYINNGLLTKDKKGVYSITPKGKARLQELTDDHSA